METATSTTALAPCSTCSCTTAAASTTVHDVSTFCEGFGADAGDADLVVTISPIAEVGATTTAVTIQWACSAALPNAFRREEQGLGILLETLAELEAGESESLDDIIPGLRSRYLLNASFLVLEYLSRAGTSSPSASSEPAPPTIGKLRALICQLDPGCTFAREAFLSKKEDADQGDSPQPLGSREEPRS